MSKPKINWDKIKQDYFKSDIEEVREYCRLFASYVSDMSERTLDRRTKGWRDEKKELRAKITAKAQEKMINNVDVQKSTELLIRGKQLIINSILKRVQNNNEKLTMNELATALDKVKIELGEPTKIDKSSVSILSIDDILRQQEEELI